MGYGLIGYGLVIGYDLIGYGCLVVGLCYCYFLMSYFCYDLDGYILDSDVFLPLVAELCLSILSTLLLMLILLTLVTVCLYLINYC